MLHPGEKTETQWRVVWFPPDRPHRTYTGSEAAVRNHAKKEHVAEWNPIVEQRDVIFGAWKPALNLTDEELNTMQRADGEMTCDICGDKYRRHLKPEPLVIPTLRQLCNGDLVKL